MSKVNIAKQFPNVIYILNQQFNDVRGWFLSAPNIFLTQSHNNYIDSKTHSLKIILAYYNDVSAI